LREEIKAIALQHPGVCNLHELRTRSSGRQYFIQLHLEMDGELKLKEAHQIANEVETEICKAFPNAEVIIHEDMEGLHEGEIRE
jgi:ferrous-iron efflux pump FieF